MLKKIIAGVLTALVLILAGFKLFYKPNNAPKKLQEVREKLTSYHMEGNMEISSNDDKRLFFVKVDYKKDNEDDLFKISLLDKNINQEQIMLRNKDGVFVLTPSLNQVYSFKGDYPLNSQKPYLYHSILSSLDGKYDLKSSSDGYLLSFTPVYENTPNWVKEDVKLSKDFKPVWVNIYDENNNICCNVNFTKVEINNEISNDEFDVDNCMNKLKETSSIITRSNDELPFVSSNILSNSTLNEKVKATVDGKTVYILSYKGEKSFTIIQSVIEENKDSEVKEVNATIVNFEKGLGYVSNNYLTYIYNGIKYEIYSDSLTVSEMIDIVSSLDMENEK